MIKEDELLQKYNKIWDKISSNIQKGFDSETLCNKKYLKSKRRSYEGKISTSFHDDRIPKESFYCICLSVILINFVFKIGKNYYLLVFLQECKYIVKEKKITRYTIIVRKSAPA